MELHYFTSTLEIITYLGQTNHIHNIQKMRQTINAQTQKDKRQKWNIKKIGLEEAKNESNVTLRPN